MTVSDEKDHGPRTSKTRNPRPAASATTCSGRRKNISDAAASARATTSPLIYAG